MNDVDINTLIVLRLNMEWEKVLLIGIMVSGIVYFSLLIIGVMGGIP